MNASILNRSYWQALSLALVITTHQFLPAESVPAQPARKESSPIQIESSGLKLTASLSGKDIVFELKDSASGTVWASGPYVYSIQEKGTASAAGLSNPSLKKIGDYLVVNGTIGETSITVNHRIIPTKTGLQENLELTNHSDKEVLLEGVGFGLSKSLDTSGTMRLIACPFRRQVDNKLHDYSSDDLIARNFSNSDGHNDAAVTDKKVCDHGLLRSEAWVLADTERSLLVAKYNPKHIENSMIAVDETSGGKVMRFGGAGLSLFSEPRGVTRIAPGQSFEFGQTSLQPVDGGWAPAYEAYRNFLNAKGHGMPSDYNPPLNWNELFDVGWYHSDVAKLAEHYTRDALMAEAAKAKEVGCDLLYLDPGWEVCEGTTLWDEKRLGKVEDFVKEVKEKYGLKVGYRTIGRVYRDEFPNDWYLQRENTSGTYERAWLTPPVTPEPAPLTKPDGRRNLALLPGTTVTASSLIKSETPFHKVDHLIDGWYGNSASWISETDPSWVVVDFGTSHSIEEIALGSEHTPVHNDRAITSFDVFISNAESADAPKWEKVFSSKGELIRQTKSFKLPKRSARRLRIEIAGAEGGTARIDELEVYEADVPLTTVAAPERKAKPAGVAGKPIDFWEVCTQSPEWQAEKIKRILAVTKGGFDFMMYDEFDWRGACHNPAHGHEIPSTPEGHVKAVLGLVEKMRAEFPHVLVEAHDPVLPWNVRYLPTYYQQGFSNNRFQENWGFEFMWHPIEDLKSGRAMCLYYYNLGCDIPLYDHITMESDNDASLSFWWYASTIRHLGIGGKKGLNSKTENEPRWQQYKKAVAEYNRLRPYYARGKFIGIEETAHLHLLPSDRSAVLNVYNLGTAPQKREVKIDTEKVGLGKASELQVTGTESKVDGNHLVLTFDLPAESPALAEIKVWK